jgi:hypothetical protein
MIEKYQEIEDNILQRVFLAESAIYACNKIVEFIDVNRPRSSVSEKMAYDNDQKIISLNYISNIFYEKSVMLLVDLFNNKLNSKGFKYLNRQKRSNKINSEINIITKSECYIKLLRARGDYFAHLSAKSRRSEHNIIFATIKKEYRDYCLLLLGKVRRVVYTNFDEPISNNYVWGKLEVGIKKLLE